MSKSKPAAKKRGETVESWRGTRVLHKAVDILCVFTQSEPVLGPSEVSEKTGLPRSTVQRIMSVLADRGILERDQTPGKYRLGVLLLTLAGRVEVRGNLRRVALPIMEELQAQTGETVNLNVVYQGERLCIEKVDSRHELRHMVQVGHRSPLWAAAAAKVLLAHLPEAQQQAVFRRAREEGWSEDQLHALQRELVTIRERGYAISTGEWTVGVTSVAAPIRDHQGIVVASVSVGGPSVRIPPERLPELTTHVTRAALRISQRLGYKPNPGHLPT